MSYIENMETRNLTSVTRKILKKAKRNIPVPFMLELEDQEQPIYCEKVVRVIPGNRVVAFGTWGDKAIVAKLFFNWNKAKKHVERDFAGIEILTAANIPTPKLYFRGTDKKRRIHVLIFERILNSCSLDELWQEKTEINELAPILRAVTVELATQHVLGVIQRDLHLKNFLVTSKTIYSLDGGSVETAETSPLAKKESLEHLALFFSQLGSGTDALKQELLDLYAKSRGWILKPADIQLLKKAIKDYNIQQWARYQKKIIRNCTAFARKNKLTSVSIYDRNYTSDNFTKLLQNPDTFFADTETTSLKLGRSSTVVKVKIDNHTLVIKRYNMKNFWHWLRRCLRPSRAASCWRIAHYLHLKGVATAKPVAFIEKRLLGLRHKSYFIMEAVEGPSAKDYFAQYDKENIVFVQVAKRIMALINQLAELRMTHGDLKATNILIHHDKPVLIDLDGVREYRNSMLFQHALHQEIKRFMKNWEDTPSIQSLFQD